MEDYKYLFKVVLTFCLTRVRVKIIKTHHFTQSRESSYEHMHILCVIQIATNAVRSKFHVAYIK